MAHKILRMRARPKILLCTSFEEAWEYFSAYQEDVLGVISDIEFPQEGRARPAGRGGVRPQGQGRLPRHPGAAPIQPPGQRSGGPRGGRRVPAQGLAHAARRPAPASSSRTSPSATSSSGCPTGPPSARATNLKSLLRAAADRPRGVDRLPRRAQRLLPLAEGPHRVPPGPSPAAAHHRRLRSPSRTGGATSSSRSTPTGASRPGSR